MGLDFSLNPKIIINSAITLQTKHPSKSIVYNEKSADIAQQYDGNNSNDDNAV